MIRTIQQAVREAAAHARRVACLGRRPRVAIFPSGRVPGSASDLRGWAMARELRRQGWTAVAVHPDLSLSQRRRYLRVARPDVVLLQQSRHPLNRPALYAGYPCVFDADDADILDERCRDTVVACVAGARRVIAGSKGLADMFRPHNPNVDVVWTGTYLRPLPPAPTPAAADVPVIAWGHSDPLAYPAEAQLLRDVLVELARTHKFSFDLYGTRPSPAADEYLAPVRAANIPVRVLPPMPYTDFANTLRGARIGLHPVCLDAAFSRGKSFGKVLAYLTAGVPIVTTNAVDHPLFFRTGENGLLVENTTDEWATACRRLLDDPPFAARLADGGRADLDARLSIRVAAEQTGRVLKAAGGIG